MSNIPKRFGLFFVINNIITGVMHFRGREIKRFLGEKTYRFSWSVSRILYSTEEGGGGSFPVHCLGVGSPGETAVKVESEFVCCWVSDDCI